MRHGHAGKAERAGGEVARAAGVGRTLEIPAGEFKSRCLRLMDEVHERRTTIVITKRGKPVAKLVPPDSAPRLQFGCMKGTVTIHGDIVAPTGEKWDAES